MGRRKTRKAQASLSGVVEFPTLILQPFYFLKHNQHFSVLPLSVFLSPLVYPFGKDRKEEFHLFVVVRNNGDTNK